MVKNEIICGDCVAVMQQLDADSVDLVVTSPPYDNLRAYQGYEFDARAVLEGLLRVVKPGGVCVWVVADQTIKGGRSLTSFQHALTARDVGWRVHDVMIWRKTNPLPGNRGSRYVDCFEYMFVFSKGKPRTFTALTKPCKRQGEQVQRTYANGRRGQPLRKSVVMNESPRWNVWDYSATNNISVKHTAPFPEPLAADHVASWSNRGDLVLDPMCGSGTTCVAAKRLGRAWIGIDVSADYCALARDRVAGDLI